MPASSGAPSATASSQKCTLSSVHAGGDAAREELDISAWFTANGRYSVLPVGRASRLGLALTGPQETRCRASRKHADIQLQNTHGNGPLALFLTDGNSQNGTFVGERHLQPGVPYRLRDGDVIGFGLPLSSAPSLMDVLIMQHGMYYNPIQFVVHGTRGLTEALFQRPSHGDASHDSTHGAAGQAETEATVPPRVQMPQQLAEVNHGEQQSESDQHGRPPQGGLPNASLPAGRTYSSHVVPANGPQLSLPDYDTSGLHSRPQTSSGLSGIMAHQHTAASSMHLQLLGFPEEAVSRGSALHGSHAPCRPSGGPPFARFGADPFAPFRTMTAASGGNSRPAAESATPGSLGSEQQVGGSRAHPLHRLFHAADARLTMPQRDMTSPRISSPSRDRGSTAGAAGTHQSGSAAGLDMPAGTPLPALEQPSRSAAILEDASGMSAAPQPLPLEGWTSGLPGVTLESTVPWLPPPQQLSVSSSQQLDTSLPAARSSEGSAAALEWQQPDSGPELGSATLPSLAEAVPTLEQPSICGPPNQGRSSQCAVRQAGMDRALGRSRNIVPHSIDLTALVSSDEDDDFIITEQPRPSQVRRTAMRQDVAGAATALGPARGNAGVGAGDEAVSLVLGLLEDHLDCPVCREWLCAAHSVAPCGHLVCGECLYKWFKLSRHGKMSCPVCRAAANSTPLPSLAVDSTLESVVEPRLATLELSDRRVRQDAWKAKLKESRDGGYSSVWELCVQHSHTRRLRMRNEGSISANIRSFAEMLPAGRTVEAYRNRMQAFASDYGVMDVSINGSGSADGRGHFMYGHHHLDTRMRRSNNSMRASSRSRVPITASQGVPMPLTPGRLAARRSGAAPSAAVPPVFSPGQWYTHQPWYPQPPLPSQSSAHAGRPEAAAGSAPGQLQYAGLPVTTPTNPRRMASSHVSYGDLSWICRACSNPILSSAVQLVVNHAGLERWGFHLQCLPPDVLITRPTGEPTLQPADRVVFQQFWASRTR